MEQLPLSAVENIYKENVSSGEEKSVLNSNTNFGKSPRKLTVHESNVISGLKQLTDVIFKPHYRIKSDMDADKMFSNNIAVSEISTENKFDKNPNKENKSEGKFLDAAAEQFCAMIVQQLKSNTNEMCDDWHGGQLKVYNAVHQQLFRPAAETESQAKKSLYEN